MTYYQMFYVFDSPVFVTLFITPLRFSSVIVVPEWVRRYSGGAREKYKKIKTSKQTKALNKKFYSLIPF